MAAAIARRPGRPRRAGPGRVARAAAEAQPRRRRGACGRGLMRRVILQALLLMGIYLLVLTSIQPADAATGFLLGLAVAVALRSRLPGRQSATPSPAALIALVPVLATTAADMVRGSWR